MKSMLSLFLGFLVLINFGCQNESAKDLKKDQKKTKKTLIIIKRKIQPENTDDIKEIIKKNKNFIKLLESFKSPTYSIDELVDLTTKDLKIFKQLHTRHFTTKADTAAVKSRLLLVEINLKKLNFLLHQKKIETDTVQKTFNKVLQNLNNVVKKIKLYGNASDEFESILTHDSIAQIKRDSLLKNQKMKDSLKLKGYQ